jgi:hypothetical protein
VFTLQIKALEGFYRVILENELIFEGEVCTHLKDRDVLVDHERQKGVGDPFEDAEEDEQVQQGRDPNPKRYVNNIR